MDTVTPLSLVTNSEQYSHLVHVPQCSYMPKQAYLFNPQRKSVKNAIVCRRGQDVYLWREVHSEANLLWELEVGRLGTSSN
jgi:hypothetical protein